MHHASADTLELLNLNVSGESFAMNITDVQEIRVIEGLRRMPNAPQCWLGVIDFREHIVPIVDLRLVFGADDNPMTEQTVVVVIQLTINGASRLVGMVVDAVSDVISISQADIKSPPDMNTEGVQVIKGVFKHNGNIVLLLDLEGLIASNDFDKVQSQLLVASDGVQ